LTRRRSENETSFTSAAIWRRPLGWIICPAAQRIAAAIEPISSGSTVPGIGSSRRTRIRPPTITIPVMSGVRTAR
jgi:hypothetical protein